MHLGDANHDWGYRVFGSTSAAGAQQCDCACSTIYVNIAEHVAAIEKNENIDVTPCTDANGAWAPSADCQAFPSTPQAATGSFPACDVARTTEPIASCGIAGPSAADGGGVDQTAFDIAASIGSAGASAIGTLSNAQTAFGRNDESNASAAKVHGGCQISQVGRDRGLFDAALALGLIATLRLRRRQRRS
jgi:hypothetical protein